MNLTKIVFISVIATVCLKVKAQQVKPLFKKIIDVTYKIDTTGKTQKIIIYDYLEVNEKGQLHYAADYDTGSVDTTYKLTDSAVAKLNTIFNGSKKLTSFMTTDKLNCTGCSFGGRLEYLTYTTTDGTEDNFILVYPFMNQAFRNIFFRIVRYPHIIRPKGKALNNRLIDQQIIKYHNSCTYIPRMDPPPTVRHLITPHPVPPTKY